MATMIQIRNVPEDVHRRMKVRAAAAGKTLSDYLLEEIAITASLPSREEMLQRLRDLPEIRTSVSAADAVREERDS